MKLVKNKKENDSAASCIMVPSRFANVAMDSTLQFNGDTSVNGMVFKGDTFAMGGDNNLASADEFLKETKRYS